MGATRSSPWVCKFQVRRRNRDGTVKLSGLRLGGARDFQISVPDDDAPCRGDKWHLDEVVLGMAGKKHRLWRAHPVRENTQDPGAS